MKNSSPEPSKCLFLIQDGVGDRPAARLGGRTPLEAARKPHMDRLIGQGRAGLMDIRGPGSRVGTDIGHLLLFGQEADLQRHRRGPIEAAGVNVILAPGQLALRFNFASVDREMRVVDRRAGRIREGTEQLIDSLNHIRLAAEYQCRFYAATEHRGVLVLSGEGLSDSISDSDPGVPLRPARKVQPLDGSAAAVKTAALLNDILVQAHQILREHPWNRSRQRQRLLPANAILTRGAGTLQRYTSLPSRLGRPVACVSGECTVLGMARLAGVDTIASAAMTANLDTSLEAKATAAVRALEEYDLVYLHLKGCDIAAHDRRPDLKVWFLEQTDRMVGELLSQSRRWPHLYLVFAGDHSTCSSCGEHTSDPVPVFLTGPGVRPDEVETYSERSCVRGGLGSLSAPAFLAAVIEGWEGGGARGMHESHLDNREPSGRFREIRRLPRALPTE